MKSIVLVAGARPNFMKIGPLWHALQQYRQRVRTVLIHTGQHFDEEMSEVFFRDLELPAPDRFLGIGGGTHAEQTARVMVAFELACLEDRPDLVVVVGDVDSTLACAITAKKMWIPVAHVEAGLRSRNWRMPEEINRIVTDSISDLLFTPSADADDNLRLEGVASDRIRRVGNIMIDSLSRSLERATGRADLALNGVGRERFGLVTLHRPSNVDDPRRLRQVVEALAKARLPLVFPVHPRTRLVFDEMERERPLEALGALRLCPPLPYLEFVDMMRSSSVVITDSGGIQEETTWLGVPCLTLREDTERPITITDGTNELTTIELLESQLDAIVDGRWKRGRRPELWDGETAPRVAKELLGFLGA